jgi:hypothetical protein
MAKRTRVPELVTHATELREAIEATIAAGEIALRALDAALEADADHIAYLWRRGAHEARDFQEFAKAVVVTANLPPGNRGYLPYDAPKDALAALGADLQTPRPKNDDDHANAAFCCAFHRELPERHTAAWDAWKANADDIIGNCPGQRLGYIARLDESEEEQKAFAADYGLDVDVDKWGDLTIPPSFDPWPDLIVGHLDEYRHRIIARCLWGHHPNDTPPNADIDEWSVIGDRSTRLHTYGPLRLYVEREYAPPEMGEAIALRHVPYDHWYRIGSRLPKQRTEQLKRSEEATLVTYLGAHAPAAQLSFI